MDKYFRLIIGMLFFDDMICMCFFMIVLCSMLLFILSKVGIICLRISRAVTSLIEGVLFVVMMILVFC